MIFTVVGEETQGALSIRIPQQFHHRRIGNSGIGKVQGQGMPETMTPDRLDSRTLAPSGDGGADSWRADPLSLRRYEQSRLSVLGTILRQVFGHRGHAI